MTLNRKIELDALSETELDEMMLATNTEVLKIAKTAQNKINKLLNRFSVQCEIALSYQVMPIDTEVSQVKKGRKNKLKHDED